MGYTLDLYKSLLLKELFGKDYEQKLRDGNLPPVDEQKMQEAIKKVYQQLDDMGPKLEDTKKAFKKFLKGSADPKLYELFEHDKGAADKYANGHKVEQFKKNREAFMKMVIEPMVRQEIEWGSAARRLGISEEKKHTLCTHTDRWTNNLMHTDGSPESLEHNDEVVALFALCYHDMTEDEFRAFRRKHYENLRKNGKLDMSDDDIARTLEDEIKNAPERILNITKSEVKDVQDEAKRLPGIVSDILGGNIDKTENGQNLESAYKAIGNRNIYISWVAEDIALLLKSFGLSDDKNLSHDDVLQLQSAGGQTNYQIMGELAANPYYTFVEPFKVYNYGKNTIQAPKASAAPKALLKEGFLKDASFAYSIIAGRDIIKHLDEYAVYPGGEKLNDRVGNFRVYQQSDPIEGGQQIERTVILKIQDMENGEPVCATEANPEELVNEGLEEEKDALRRRVSKWSKENKTSKQFEAMREALIVFNEMKLTDKSVLKDFKEFEKKLDELQKAVDEYLEKKANDNAKIFHYSSSYEKERVEFANKLKEFTERKKKEIGYAQKFIRTRQLKKQADVDMKAVPEKGSNERYKKLSGLAYMIEKGKEEKKRKIELQAKEKKEQKKLEQEKEEKEQAASGRGYRKQLDELKKKIGKQAPDKDDERAQSKVKAYIDARQAGYDSAKKDSDKAFEAKKMLAALAINEYLKMESRQKKEPEDWSIHELVNAGKINELTDFVMHTDYFVKRFAQNDEPIDKTILDGHKKNPAQCYYVSKNIAQCMDLASKADKSKEEQIDKLEDIREKEEIKEELKEEGKEANDIAKGRESVRRLSNINELIEEKEKEDGKMVAGVKKSTSVPKSTRKKTIKNVQKNVNEADNKQKAPEPLGGKGIGPKKRTKKENE